jgi:hypothetical protein
LGRTYRTGTVLCETATPRPPGPDVGSGKLWQGVYGYAIGLAVGFIEDMVVGGDDHVSTSLHRMWFRAIIETVVPEDNDLFQYATEISEKPRPLVICSSFGELTRFQ